MSKKILIADDSALMRKLLSDIITSNGRYQKVDTVANGMQAWWALEAGIRYDLLLLDLNMPVMDGMELLQKMTGLKNKPPVIVISSIATEGASVTIRALELGAFDFITKPASAAEINEAIFQKKLFDMMDQAIGPDSVSVESKEKLGAAARGRTESSPGWDMSSASVKTDKGRIKGNYEKLVVIASSTGGPKALQILIPALSGKLDAPVLLVQHMPEGFTLSLAERLNELSDIRVQEAEDGMALQKGVVYIAKGGHQMRLVTDSHGRYNLAVTKEEARNGLRPCADVLFESMVPYLFSSLTCVVLTGMGQDATKGILQLPNKQNNYIIAQNQETCTEVSAIKPRMPANCLICACEPRAPESAIMKMLL